METKHAKQTAREATERAGRKTAYTPPQVEIIKMEVEGVIAGSPGASLSDFGTGSTIQQSRTYRSYNSASGSDLEDLINDILTVEQ